MIRKVFVPSLMAIAIVASIFLMTNFGYEQRAIAVEVQQDVVANLAQRIEELHQELIILRKQILLLTDLLDDMQAAIKAKPVASTSVQTAAASKPALRSPRQIDRPPIGNEKSPLLVAKMKVLISDAEVQRILEKLISSKNSSEFVQSLRAQVTDWLQVSEDDRAFDSPLSPKQFAWAAHLMYRSEYPNPKTIKSLYPNG